MTDPTADRRARLWASHDELARVAEDLSATVAAFKAQLAEQEEALDAARSAEPLRRLMAEIRRLKEQHAADLRKATVAADEGARDAGRFEAERNASVARSAGAERQVVRLEVDLKEARAERDAARAEAATLRRGAAASAQQAVAPRLPASAVAPRPVPPPAPKAMATAPPRAASQTPANRAVSAPAPSATGRAVVSAFQEWCATVGAVVGKVGFFAESLRQRVPGATASAVYRDANSQALPIVLGSGGSSPVEYWLVAAEGRHWLFPQPVSPGQFRELAPCFDGAATPAVLTAIRPAEVRRSGDQLDLDQRGHVA